MNALLAAALLMGPVDVVHLGRERPVHIRFRVSVDGRSPDAARDAYLKELFQFLDRNGDGILSGNELPLVPAASDLESLLGQTRAGFYTAPGSAAKREELDREGKDRVTLTAFLTYYQQRLPAVRITFHSARGEKAEAYTESLFRILDADGDGRISKGEAGDVERRLAKFDANEDELITLEEVAELSGVMPPRKADVFVLGGSGETRTTAMREISKKLLEQYDRDKNGRLTQMELGIEAGTFKQLDRNGDGELDAAELTAFADHTPGTERTIKLGALQVTGSRMDFGSTRFEVRADRVEDIRAKSARAFLTQQFKAADARAKGFLDAADVTRPQNRFFGPILHIADRNGDGQLSESELTVWFDLQDQGRRNFVSFSISDEGRDLFGLLDANQDGRLDPHELRSVWVRLGMRSVSRVELQRIIQLRFTQGPCNEIPPPREPLVPAKLPKSMPEWFTKMDRNCDGHISQKEWLGTPARFVELDLDGDGLIDVQEALAAGKKP